jgi:hypothetical protein
MAKDTSHLPVYKPTQFGKERQLNIRYGNNPSRKELRQFNDYWNSEQRFVDEHNHYMSELDKMFDSVQRNMEYLRNKYKPVQITPLQTSASTEKPSQDSKDTVVPEDTKKNQPQNLNENNAASNNPTFPWEAGPMYSVPWAPTYIGTLTPPPSLGSLNGQGSSTSTGLPFTPKLTVNALWDSHLFDKYVADIGITDRTRIIVNGKPYFVVKTTNFERNKSGILPNMWYAFDPNTGRIRRLKFASFSQTPFSRTEHKSSVSKKPIEGGQFVEGSSWKNPQALFEIYPTPQSISTKKQGGIMNKINYFQQGGATPQQDMQQQIVALVQAAMQGDEKAVSTVNQIIEAAKSGDPQAVQLAQIIQQVLQQMQGQTASARLGAKLNYIRSLKYAKGGKTCQACNKKVEMKACGGKKAKKRYFGGLI